MMEGIRADPALRSHSVSGHELLYPTKITQQHQQDVALRT